MKHLDEETIFFVPAAHSPEADNACLYNKATFKLFCIGRQKDSLESDQILISVNLPYRNTLLLLIQIPIHENFHQT